MSQAPAKSLESLTGDSQTITTITDHVVAGGSLAELCDVWGVRYGQILNWIRADKERMAAYDKALHDRDDYDRERMLIQTRKIAQVDVTSVLDEDLKMKPKKDWPDAVSKSMNSFEIGDDGRMKKFKNSEKLKAIELHAKLTGKFVQEVKHSGAIKLEDMVGESMPEHLKPKIGGS